MSDHDAHDHTGVPGVGVASGGNPNFTTIELGHASDTTIARASAGNLTVEGNAIYRAGGTDVPVTDGGTGASSASAARTNLGLVLGTDVASLTAGVVPIAQLATGTPDGTKFIRDDGTLQTPAGGGGGGGLVLLEQHTASASATLDFTTFISSTYDEYQIDFVNILPATNTDNLYMRMGTGGGPTYDAGTNYGYGSLEWQIAGSGLGGAESGQTVIAVSRNGIANGASLWGLNGRLLMSLVSAGGKYTEVNGMTTYRFGGGAVMILSQMWGTYQTTTAVTAVRFLASTGNLTSGTIRIYGLEK